MARHRQEDPHGLGDEQLTRNDMRYSPGSERETQELQDEPAASPARRDVDASEIGNLPGTGGPDDSGDFIAPTGEDTDREQ